MRLTDDDLQILEAIHAYDGMLGAKQIMRLTSRSWHAIRKRLSKLYQNGYIARPDRHQRAALPDMVYWLAPRGAEQVAGLSGKDLSEFRWRKQLRLSMVAHDLAVNDFRITVFLTCKDNPYLELAEWVSSGEFWAYPDQVDYRDISGKAVHRKVRPDGYFLLRFWSEPHGLWGRKRFLLELDRSTEDNPRFAREKVRPGIAYLQSTAYEKRFGNKGGCWLIVTTGERRMLNMKRQTESTVEKDQHAANFYFTTLDQVSEETVLTAPIWLPGGSDQSISLL